MVSNAANRVRYEQRRVGYVLAVLVMLLSVLVIVARTAHAGTPITVTLTIQRFVQVDDPNSGCCESANGTYYAVADIGGTGSYQDSRNLGYGEQANTPDVLPYWRFTKTVDSSLGTIPINFQVRDDDTGVAFSTDDVMDINPVVGVREMHTSFNLQTGDWSGDNGGPNLGWSEGNGDSERGKVLFDIGFNDDNSAGDGIPDGVKHSSVYDISDGHALANMATLGADPCRKNVAVQIDYMSGAADGHTHYPLGAAQTLIRNTYNNAPVAAVSPCHYPGFPLKPSGVDFVYFIDHAVPELAAMLPDDTNYLADKKAGFPEGLGPYFFYLIMAHDQAAGNSSSGKSCPSNSKDFEVSLGTSWTNEVGTATDQAASIMHELGHCLGLGHGGGDSINCKPNYLSLMNYDFQITGIPSATGGPVRYDYSRQALPNLNESTLSESGGLGGDGKDLTVWTPDNGATAITGATSGALDWDNEDKPAAADTDGDSVNVDVNAFGNDKNNAETCFAAQPNPNPSPGQTLNGYDDWGSLKYRGPLASATSSPGGSGVSHAGDDINFAQAQLAKAFWATVFTTATGAPPLAGVEGSTLQGATVATVTDSEPTATAAQFTANVDWGDATKSVGTIVGPTGGPFTVFGDHSYSEEGTYTVTMTLQDPGGAKKVATTTAAIADAPLSAQGTSVVTTNPFSGTVATFTDADPGAVVSDYTASIDWGDNTTSAGSVVVSGAGFAVNGTHSYTVLGPYTATISITDVGGASATSTTNIIMFAFPTRGDFVVGDRDSAVGQKVTFWGDQWARANAFSGGPAPLSFKGYENSLTPPKCGATWQTNPGVSSNPVSTIPSYMGTIVSSRVNKSASNIFSGNIPELVVIKTNSGYSTDPSIGGTGTVFAVICQM